MQINRIVEKTQAEGPGVRFSIWVQGCSHRCKGCFATDLWDKNGGTEMTAEDIIGKMKSVLPAVRGVTLLGGEPFEQAAGLAKVAQFAKSNGLDVIAFSGYTYEELLADSANCELLKNVDLLIDGRYMAEQQDFSRPLVGSKNQRFIYLTDAIAKAEIDCYKNRFEIRTDENGKVYFNGMGNIEKLKEYTKKLRS
ncbi:MAG: radical SAM protein [Eubacterium sp.]|nr:radical SAM protein [Eubacterium sp.]